MARSFNGTSQYASVPIDLSSYTKVAIAMWLWTTFPADRAIAEFGYSASAATNHLEIYTTSSSTILVGASSSSGQSNYAEFAQPSASTWHHYVFNFDRAIATASAYGGSVYVDGVAQTTTLSSFPSPGQLAGNFTNDTLYLMSRLGSSFFLSGLLGGSAVYPGVNLSANEAMFLAYGGNPLRCATQPISFIPFWGYDATDSDYGSARASVILGNSPTRANNPPVRPFTKKSESPLIEVAAGGGTTRSKLRGLASGSILLGGLVT